MTGKKITLPHDGETYISQKAFFNAGKLFPKGTIFTIDETCNNTVMGGLQREGEPVGHLSFMKLHQFRQIFKPVTA